jgi:hypothetical protein
LKLREKGRIIMEKIVKLDNESENQVCGGYTFIENGNGFAVVPTQKGERLAFLIDGYFYPTFDVCAEDDGAGGLQWNDPGVGKFKSEDMRPGCYIVDQFGNKTGSDLKPISHNICFDVYDIPNSEELGWLRT